MDKHFMGQDIGRRNHIGLAEEGPHHDWLVKMTEMLMMVMMVTTKMMTEVVSENNR